jgi:hypothetical protein
MNKNVVIVRQEQMICLALAEKGKKGIEDSFTKWKMY